MNDKTNKTNKQPSFQLNDNKRFNKKRAPRRDDRQSEERSDNRAFNRNRRDDRRSDDRNDNRSFNRNRRDDRRSDDRNDNRSFNRNRRDDRRSDDRNDNRSFTRNQRDDRRSDDRNDNRSFNRNRRDNRQRDERKADAFAWPESGAFSGESRGNNQTDKHSVQVMVKGHAKRSEKKSGPLSPRAPEKIRKNRAEEMKVYGEAAVATLFAQRPESIVRLWLTVEAAKKFPELMSYLAANKRAYHVVERDEMNLVCGSEHHGDICLLVKKQIPMTLKGYLQVARTQDCLLWIDGIQNAYNVGGIMRTAAYYGCKGLICSDLDNLYSPAAMRVAEGGAEFLYGLQISEHMSALEQLIKADYQIIMVSENKKLTAFNEIKLSDKVVFVLSEDANIEAMLTQQKQIKQTVLSFDNPLKSSLNSAVKAGVLLSRWYLR